MGARQTNEGPPDWSLEPPPHWLEGSGWDRVDVMLEVTLRKGLAILVTATVKDGTNVMGLLWSGGQRLMRMGPATDWALQEHFTGTMPRGDEKVIRKVWAKALKCMIEAKAMTEAEIGPPPGIGRR